MTSSISRPSPQLNRPLLGSGVVLLWVGGIVWLSGAALAAIALAQAAKRWMDQLEESPSEMARRRMHQLRVAASAGSKAWREQSS